MTTNSVMTQGSLPRLLQEGINAVAGTEYADYSPEYAKIYDTKSSDKAYEVDVMESGTGLLSRKAEGGAISYDGAKQDYTKKYTSTTYGLGGIITMEALMDNQYMDMADKLGKMLKRSAVHTDEQLAANVINNGYTSGFTGGDGQTLFSQSHPLGKGGTFANANSSFVAFSQAAMEDALTAIGGYTDGAGLQIDCRGVSLHIPRQLQWDAARVLKSAQEPDTGNNAINPVNGIMPYHVNHRFSSATEWFIKTDVMDGFKRILRMPYTFETDNDFGTSNYRHKVMFRVDYGWTDPRCAYGSGQ